MTRLCRTNVALVQATGVSERPEDGLVSASFRIHHCPIEMCATRPSTTGSTVDKCSALTIAVSAAPLMFGQPEDAYFWYTLLRAWSDGFEAELMPHRLVYFERFAGKFGGIDRMYVLALIEDSAPVVEGMLRVAGDAAFPRLHEAHEELRRVKWPRRIEPTAHVSSVLQRVALSPIGSPFFGRPQDLSREEREEWQLTVYQSVNPKEIK